MQVCAWRLKGASVGWKVGVVAWRVSHKQKNSRWTWAHVFLVWKGFERVHRERITKRVGEEDQVRDLSGASAERIGSSSWLSSETEEELEVKESAGPVHCDILPSWKALDPFQGWLTQLPHCTILGLPKHSVYERKSFDPRGEIARHGLFFD